MRCDRLGHTLATGVVPLTAMEATQDVSRRKVAQRRKLVVRARDRNMQWRSGIDKVRILRVCHG